MKYVWIIWKREKIELGNLLSSAKIEIHAVCSTRDIAAKENIKLHKQGIGSWTGKYLIDNRVHWSADDTDPI